MSKVVFLDTGVLGYVTHPKGSAESQSCTKWLVGLLAAGARVCIPEVCDFELRREYIRTRGEKALAKLEQLKRAIYYVPINTEAMLAAADLWAKARMRGRPTADPKELDIDVVLAAQALESLVDGDDLVIATNNVGHLAQFAAAKTWRDIAP